MHDRAQDVVVHVANDSWSNHLGTTHVEGRAFLRFPAARLSAIRRTESKIRQEKCMTELNYRDVVSRQREYFVSGATRPVAWRRHQLEALKALLEDNRGRFLSALDHDLRRNEVDADLMDIGFCIKEADYALKHMRGWMRAEHEPTPLVLKPGNVRVRHEPLGVTLIIGAWNEPLMLTFGPLVPALAAGNTAVIKPSEMCAATAALIGELVPEYMDPAAVAVVQGAVPETTALLAERWDLIFFTGSPQVGKIIHQAAAKNLTPTVLELGGKNPAIVHPSADVKVAARRLAHGRFSNAGQICTSPDHVLVWPQVKAELVDSLRKSIHDFYGSDPQQSPDYGRIVNRKNTERLAGLLDGGTAVVGGQVDLDDLYIAPTVLVDVALDSPVMQEEIFGPILPILEVDSVKAAIDWVNGHEAPLCLYVFAEDEHIVEQIVVATASGDVVVNDCTLHPLIPELPFGGVGNSGMGKYHGRWGFDAFTNVRGVLHHSTKFDPGVRYPPYAEHGFERMIESKLS
jgi:acyl-CoA reductase-like NAD-dependent aldehyde dehydrogenase